MRADYEHRSQAWVDDHYRDSKARGGVGWAHIPDKMLPAADRLEQLVRQYPPPGGRMLEIGCGAGDISVMLAPRGLFSEIHAVDISETAIAWAREKAVQGGLTVQFHVGNMVELRDFGDASFDAVIAFACLHWVIGDDRRDCLASVHRVLRRGGNFYLWTSCRDVAFTEPPDRTKEHYFDPESGVLVRNRIPCFHLRTPEEMQAELASADLEVLYWVVEPREEDDSPYFLGPVIAVAWRQAAP